MRNLIEHPVTKQELKDYIERLNQEVHTDNVDKPALGDMRAIYIQILANLVQENFHDDYFDQLSAFFNVVRDRTVLDVGCSSCDYWPTIERHQPKEITGLEPRPEDWGSADKNVIKGSYEDYLPHEGYDVILSFGLVYKLANPLDLVEKICQSNPEYVIFEDIGPPVENQVVFNEDLSQLGGYSGPRRLHMPVRLVPEVYDHAFDKMGYELELAKVIYSSKPTKNSVRVGRYRKR